MFFKNNEKFFNCEVSVCLVTYMKLCIFNLYLNIIIYMLHDVQSKLNTVK